MRIQGYHFGSSARTMEIFKTHSGPSQGPVLPSAVDMPGPGTHLQRAKKVILFVQQVLSPVQVARYLVACYPMGPDTLSLMNFLAQKGGEPSAGDLMQDARTETAADAQDMPDSFGSSLDWRDMLHGWPELTNGQS